MAASGRARSRRTGSPATAIALASLGAAVVLSGIQGIAPAIPAIQAEFALSTAEVALITSVYLFPSIFSSFAAGVLADRIGIRPVFATSLAVFGAGAVVLLVEPSFWALMCVRFVQGAAFGAVLSLSIGIIGAVAPAGVEAARGQSRRAIAIAMGEAMLPAAGGLLLAVAWFAPFALGLLAIPLAVASWFALPPLARGRRTGVRGNSRAALKAPAIVEVQTLGALRFVFKFAVITYYPVLAVTDVGMSPAVVGVALGASALLTVAAAAYTERLAHRWSSAQMIGGCLVLITVCMVGMGVAGGPVVLIAALLVFGLQDGVFAVAHNVMVTELAPAQARSTYIGLTGTVRNIGKFAAPLVFGAATLAATVSGSFLGLAGAGLLSLAVARRVARVHTDRVVQH